MQYCDTIAKTPKFVILHQMDPSVKLEESKASTLVISIEGNIFIIKKKWFYKGNMPDLFSFYKYLVLVLS